MAETRSPLPRRPKAAIYIRVSTSKQEEGGTSLQTQEQRCRDYAVARGFDPVFVFSDTHTGSELFERPQLSRLLGLVRNRAIDVVVIYAFDRLSRNQTHFGYILSEFGHAGVTLEVVTEDRDDSPEGQLIQMVRGYVAETERIKIIERTRGGIRAMVEGGRPIPGQKAPYGYRWRDSRKSGYEFDPATKEIARRIYDRVLAGDSLRSIAKALTGEGIPTPTGRGKKWEVSTLHGVLENPIYMGQVFAYRHRSTRIEGQRSPKVVPRPIDEQIQLPAGTAPALVTAEEFEAVQQRLAYNRATAPRNNANPEATLLRCGIARCGYCGRALSITKRKNKPHHMYRCHPGNSWRHDCPSFGILAPILDGYVWNCVREFMLSEKMLEDAIARHGGGQRYEQQIASLDRRLAKIARQQAKVAQAIGRGLDDDVSEPLLAELANLATERKEALEGRDALVRAANAATADRQRLMDLKAWRQRVSVNLEKLTYDQKRMVLEGLGVTANVYRQDHEPRIEVTIAPPPIERDGDGIVFSNRNRFSTAMPASIPRPSTD